MKNKILLSVATSLLLTSTAFATEVGTSGSLSIGAGNGVSTIEYHDKYGDTNSLDFTDINYTASIKGSGSVSDALVRIDVTDTNLSVHGLDLDAIFENQRIMKFDTNETVAAYDKSIVDDDGKTWVLFAGNSDQSVINGKSYTMRKNDNNTTSGVTYQFVDGNKLTVDVWSTSGSEEIRGIQSTTTSSQVKAQFSTSCITKFDGLINIEALQDSFVSTAHDNDSTTNPGVTDGLSQWDTLVFTVTNTKVGNSLEGNASAITMQTRNADGSINVDNNFSNDTIWKSQIVEVQQDGTSATYLLSHDIASLTTQAALKNPTTGTGTWNYTTDGNLTFVLPSDKVIPAGTTTYYVGLNHQSAKGGIKPVHFVNARLALEAGMLDDNNTIYPAADTPRGAALDAGKWVNHAFIAQIPAGESGGAAGMLTRYFITNRSCKVVTPQIDVVYNGEVYRATNVAALPIDTQKEYALKDIMLSIPELATVWNANTSTKVSVEITLPGIAEQFYVYAQVKNKSINQFKDLPVYSTSERD